MISNIVAQRAWPVPKQIGQEFADCRRLPKSKAHMEDSLDQNLRWRQATPKEMEKICRETSCPTFPDAPVTRIIAHSSWLPSDQLSAQPEIAEISDTMLEFGFGRPEPQFFL
jgi:hypothetical protein